MNNFTIDIDNDGIALVTFDVPGRSMNTLTNEVIGEIDELAEKIASDDAIKGAVITSGKASGFCAGADLGEMGGGLFGGRRFGRADVHARIELTGINRENAAIELLGQGNSKAGLAAGRWPQNQHHQWGHCIPCLNSPGDSSRTAHGSRW